MKQFSSNKPYLLNAIYDWILDNNGTPHIVLFADNPQVTVPRQFVENGKIILNISPEATQGLLIDKDGISFSTRFGGKPYTIYSPIGAVLALYARENNQGLTFKAEDSDDTPPDNPPGNKSNGVAKNKKEKPPFLKVVK